MTLSYRKKGEIGYKMVDVEEAEIIEYGICEAKGNTFRFKDIAPCSGDVCEVEL